MVAGGEGQDAAIACLWRELRERVVCAAELEGSRSLKVLALEKEPRAGHLVERARCQDRCVMSLMLETGRRGVDLGVAHAGDHR